MKKYNQIINEIKKLEKQAVKARKAEIRAAVAEIKKLVEKFDLKLEELGIPLVHGKGKTKTKTAMKKRPASKTKKAAAKAKPKAKAKSKAKKGSTYSAPKYRSPDDASKTWTGHGRRPKWAVDWLAAGKEMSKLEIK